MKKVLNDLIGYLSENVSESDIIAAEQLARISVIIATERIKRGMTQAEFAEYMGVSQSMVSKWESEDYNYSIESLASICVKLGLDFVVEMKPKTENKIRYIPRSKWITDKMIRYVE